jgi:hypothetical protein
MRFVAFLRCVEDEQAAVNASRIVEDPSRIAVNARTFVVNAPAPSERVNVSRERIAAAGSR